MCSRVPLQAGIQILDLHVQERPQRSPRADIVDGGGEPVALAELGGGGPEGRGNRVGVGGVGGDAEGAAAGGVDLGDEVAEAILATGEKDDGVGLGEALGLVGVGFSMSAQRGLIYV